MFSSPSQNGQPEPGKTPSKWAAALGIFSTAKKPPRQPHAEAGTNNTMTGEFHNANDLSAVAEASFQQHGSTANGGTGLDSSMVSENETFMSPLSPHLSTAGKSVFSTGHSNAMMTSPAGTGNSGRHKASRLEFSSLGPSRMTNAAGVASTPLAEGATNQLASFSTMAVGGGVSKSPWLNNNSNHNKNGTRGVSFQLGTNTPVGARSPWQGKRSRTRRNDTPGAKAAPQQHNMMSRPISFRTGGVTSQRAGMYRPNALLLVGSETLGRRTRKLDPARLSNALLTLKDNYFMPDVANNDSSNVYARPGKVKYGPLSHASRTPRMQQKRQRPVERLPPAEDSEGERRSSKRQKKVCFDQEDNEEEDNAVVSRLTATPFRSTAMRKGTPMPRKLMESSPAETTTAADSMSYEPDHDEGDNAGTASVASSQSNDQLPDPPPLVEFDSNNPFSFQGDMSKAMVPVKLDPSEQSLLFKQNNFPGLSGAPAVADPSENELVSYNRPPSPVRERIKYDDDDDDNDDDNGSGGQKTKRMKKDEKVPDWKCSKCGKMNDNEESRCTKEDCQTGRSVEGTEIGWGNLLDGFKKEGEWKCQVCLASNPKDATKCKACEEPKDAEGVTAGEDKKKTASPAPAAEMKTSFPFATNNNAKPGGFSFGSNPTPTLSVPAGTAETSKFTFAATPATKTAPSATPATVGGFTFGGATTPAAAAPPPAPTTGGFSFGGDDAKKSSAPITFGSTPAPAPAAAESATPAFGAPPTTASDQPVFAFGASAAKTNGDSSTPSDSAPAPTSTFAFGEKKDEKTPAPTPAATTPAIQFGVGASAPSTGTSFGASASTPAPPATNGNSGFSFGASTPAPSVPPESKSTQKVKRSRGYDLNGGDSKAAPAPASAAKPAPAPTLFGAPAPTAPSTEAPFKFGSTPAAADSGAPKPFGSTPAVPFGGTPAAPAPAPVPSGGIQFGATTPAPAAPAGGTGIFTFGASQTPAPAPAAPGGFGAPPAATGPAPAAFGATPVAPAFGATPAPAVPAFGSTPAAPAPAATAFGSTPAAPTPAATTFGSTPAVQPPAFGFGGAGQAPAFGAPAPVAPAFGGASNPQSSTGFGAAPAFGAQTPAAPPGGGFSGSFGTNQPPNTGGFGSTPAAPSAAGFGSTPAAPSAGGFGGTGFGAPQTGGFQSTPAAPGGFGGGGFGGAAPNTAPPGGGGGFSIGSSGAPKPKRRLVRAKRPTRPA